MGVGDLDQGGFDLQASAGPRAGVSPLRRVGSPNASVLAHERRIPVLPSLETLLPGGMTRGATIGVTGSGSLSLALALMAGAAREETWFAAVGIDGLCLAAVGDAGVPLHRFVVVSRPEPRLWSPVVSALFDSFEIVLVSPVAKVSAGHARRLRARARDRGAVLIDMSPMWPEAHDLRLKLTASSWTGLGRGHGSLEARLVMVEVEGRRGVPPRSVPLLLPGIDGFVEVPEVDSSTGVDPVNAGSDIDPLLVVSTPDPAILRSAG